MYRYGEQSYSCRNNPELSQHRWFPAINLLDQSKIEILLPTISKKYPLLVLCCIALENCPFRFTVPRCI